MAKITQTEFKKWSQELRETYIALLKPSSGISFTDEAAEKQFISIGSITSLYASKGVTNAILLGMLHLEGIGLKNDVPFIQLGGLTFRAWEEKIFNRLKEHSVAGGFHNPNSPPTSLYWKSEEKKQINFLLIDRRSINYLIMLIVKSMNSFLTLIVIMKVSRRLLVVVIMRKMMLTFLAELIFLLKIGWEE